MSTILTNSIARDHLLTMQATARSARFAREARYARRAARRAERRNRHAENNSDSHHRAAAMGHAAAWPFSAARQWLVAGQL